jgi:hypothetical protein
MNFEEVVTRGLRALLDGGDRLVDLENLGDRDATLLADIWCVKRPIQPANEGLTRLE